MYAFAFDARARPRHDLTIIPNLAATEKSKQNGGLKAAATNSNDEETGERPALSGARLIEK